MEEIALQNVKKGVKIGAEERKSQPSAKTGGKGKGKQQKGKKGRRDDSEEEETKTTDDFIPTMISTE